MQMFDMHLIVRALEEFFRLLSFSDMKSAFISDGFLYNGSIFGGKSMERWIV